MQAPSQLILGWKVNHAMDPTPAAHTRRSRLASGLSAAVAIDSSKAVKHTAIVAQSGSGKSFFLVRLIEEILIRTRANVLVLDPNGDFVKIRQIEDDHLWSDDSYDPVSRNGKLTHERDRREFSSLWERVPIRVRVGMAARHLPDAERMLLHWTDVNATLVSSDCDVPLRHEVLNCHRIIQLLGTLCDFRHRAIPDDQPEDLLGIAERLLFPAGASGDLQIPAFLSRQFDPDVIANAIVEKESTVTRGANKTRMAIREWLGRETRSEISSAAEEVQKLSKYISKESARYYFRRSQSLASNPIFSTLSKKPTDPKGIRLDIVDLSSVLEQDIRQFVVNATMAQCWSRAIDSWRRSLVANGSSEQRVPTFVVVDEAHNIIPSEPRDSGASIVKEQFRTLAAEGRKYDIFLIAVSQRPDKLDPFVLSECENKVIMRIGSESVLSRTKELLGLEDVPDKMINRILDFPAGRGMLAGAWVPDSHTFFYAAARRTREGSKGLSPDWARPFHAGRSRADSKVPARKRKRRR